MATTVLTKKIYTVAVTGAPTEAQHLPEEGGHSDRLLPDIVIPGINGWEQAEALQILLPQLKCL